MASKKHHGDVLTGLLIVPGLLISLLGIVIMISSSNRKAPADMLLFSGAYILAIGSITLVSGILFAAIRKSIFALAGVAALVFSVLVPVLLGQPSIKILNILIWIYCAFLVIRFASYANAKDA